MSKKPPKDANQTAKMIIDKITGELREKDPAAVSLGRRGGLKGGKLRAEKLSDERKSEIASEAAKARWKNHKKKKR